MTHHCTMMPLAQIVVTAIEAVGEALSRRKPKTAEEAERQRLFRRNERAMSFFVLFAFLLSAVLLLIMAFP